MVKRPDRLKTRPPSGTGRKTKQPIHNIGLQNIRYLRFLCEEFNYNSEYILGIVEEPQFNDSCKADDFPELDRILETVNKYPVLALAFRKLLFKTDVGLIKDLHLQIFHKHPELYDEFKNLVHTVEKHPELFDLLTKFKLPPC